MLLSCVHVAPQIIVIVVVHQCASCLDCVIAVCPCGYPGTSSSLSVCMSVWQLPRSLLLLSVPVVALAAWECCCCLHHCLTLWAAQVIVVVTIVSGVLSACIVVVWCGREGGGGGWCCTGGVVVVVSGVVSLPSMALVVVASSCHFAIMIVVVAIGCGGERLYHCLVQWRGSWWWLELH